MRAPPPPPPVSAGIAVPPGACDAHVHLVASDRPLHPGRVEDPPEGTLEAWVARLEAHLAALGLARVLVVHSILHGADNGVTLDGVAALGDRARAVVLVPADVSDAELDRLAAARAVAVRLNLVHGGILDWAGAVALAPRLADRGMHLQILMRAGIEGPQVLADLPALPCPLVIDHLGWPTLPAAPEAEMLERLMAAGAYVKLSALYRVCPPPWDAADALVARLARTPERCLWGSDWPHLMLADAPMPGAAALLAAFARAVPEPARAAILAETPGRLFFA